MDGFKYEFPPKLENQLSDFQIERAFRFWFASYAHREIDVAVEKFFGIPIRRDWLEKVRQAQHLRIADMAKRLKMRDESYRKIELSEQAGTISFESLSKVAAAMNCDLVYGLRPKTGKKICWQIWEKLVALYQEEPWVKSRPEHLKANALACVARDKFKDQKIKKKLLRF